MGIEETPGGAPLDHLFQPGADGEAAAGSPALPRSFVDAHAHVFNASDLPVYRFLERVYFEEFDGHGVTLPILVLSFIGSEIVSKAISAEDELHGIDDVVAALAPSAASNALVDDLERFLSSLWTPGPDAETNALRIRLRSEIAGMTVAAQGVATAARLQRDRDFRGMAEELERSSLGPLFAWAAKFGRSRAENVADFGQLYAEGPRKCALTAPALIDYDHWLVSPPKRGSHLHQQVAVMGAISKRRSRAPSVHGFVAFDPLRAALWNRKRNGLLVDETGDFGRDPHETVREAIAEHGFLGVKLYPPMGFRALDNDAADMTFHDDVKGHFGTRDGVPVIDDRTLGRYLDEELQRLYLWCARNDVPILAHGYNSQAAGNGYGLRASPQYWGKAIDFVSNAGTSSTPPARLQLRLCLAHYGAFDAHARGTACAELAWADKVWEVMFGRVLANANSAHVYADLSYLTPVLDDSPQNRPCLQKLGTLLARYVREFDRECRHLVYGSDWIMLGKEAGHESYAERLARFLRDEVGLGAEQRANIFRHNAVRLFGLDAGGAGRARLAQFHGAAIAGELFAELDATD